MGSTLLNVLKAAAMAALAAVSAQAGAATVAVGLLGASNATLSHTFNAKGSFTDYYTFTIGANSNGIAGITSDSAKSSSVRDVSISQFMLSGGSLGSSLIDTTIGDGFSFVGLGAGSYTLAITGSVSVTSAWFNNDSSSYSGSYSGSFHALAAPGAAVASPAPEPADFALALMGLVGVGFMVRRRGSR
jgi:hypothetical protein